jgi:hypothetical protein
MYKMEWNPTINIKLVYYSLFTLQYSCAEQKDWVYKYFVGPILII